MLYGNSKTNVLGVAPDRSSGACSVGAQPTMPNSTQFAQSSCSAWSSTISALQPELGRFVIQFASAGVPSTPAGFATP